MYIIELIPGSLMSKKLGKMYWQLFPCMIIYCLEVECWMTAFPVIIRDYQHIAIIEVKFERTVILILTQLIGRWYMYSTIHIYLNMFFHLFSSIVLCLCIFCPFSLGLLSLVSVSFILCSCVYLLLSLHPSSLISASIISCLCIFYLY